MGKRDVDLHMQKGVQNGSRQFMEDTHCESQEKTLEKCFTTWHWEAAAAFFSNKTTLGGIRPKTAQWDYI